MKISILKAIATKDLLEVRQNKAAWMPMVIVPLVFVLLLPLGLILGPQLFNVPLDEFLADPDLETFLANMPPVLMKTVDGLNAVQSAIVVGLGYMFAPMFLIFPAHVFDRDCRRVLCRRTRAQDNGGIALYPGH